MGFETRQVTMPITARTLPWSNIRPQFYISTSHGLLKPMEKQGLIKVLEKLEASNIEIESLTTDRLGQVRKYLRKNSIIPHHLAYLARCKKCPG